MKSVLLICGMAALLWAHDVTSAPKPASLSWLKESLLLDEATHKKLKAEITSFKAERKSDEEKSDEKRSALREELVAEWKKSDPSLERIDSISKAIGERTHENLLRFSEHQTKIRKMLTAEQFDHYLTLRKKIYHCPTKQSDTEKSCDQAGKKMACPKDKASCAQSRQKGREAKDGAWLKKSLLLDAATHKKLEAEIASFKAELASDEEKSGEKRDALRKKLMAEVKKTDPSLARIDSISEAIGERTHEDLVRFSEHQIKVRKMLTAEQYDRYLTLRKKLYRCSPMRSGAESAACDQMGKKDCDAKKAGHGKGAHGKGAHGKK